MEKISVSHTSLTTYKDCKAKYDHYYNRRMDIRVVAPYFIFGRALHSALEYLYINRSREGMYLEIDKAYDEVDKAFLTPDQINDLEVQKAMVTGIVDVYPDFYSDDFLTYKTFRIEEEFEIPFGVAHGHELFYNGKIDGLMQDEAGDWWILETKTATAASVTPDYIKRIGIDSQTLGYHWGAKAILGVFPRGVVYNIIKKTMIRKKKGETNAQFRERVKEEYLVNGVAKEYFIRHEPVIDKKMLLLWKKETTEYLKEIAKKKATKSKLWPMNSNACSAKWGTCKFLDACCQRRYNKLLYAKRPERNKDTSIGQTSKS